jgi:hypothetical protein
MPSNRPGDHGEGAIPDPIPNSVVKPFSVDGTAWETAWESRTSPGLFRQTRASREARVCAFWRGVERSQGGAGARRVGLGVVRRPSSRCADTRHRLHVGGGQKAGIPVKNAFVPVPHTDFHLLARACGQCGQLAELSKACGRPLRPSTGRHCPRARRAPGVRRRADSQIRTMNKILAAFGGERVLHRVHAEVDHRQQLHGRVSHRFSKGARTKKCQAGISWSRFSSSLWRARRRQAPRTTLLGALSASRGAIDGSV